MDFTRSRSNGAVADVVTSVWSAKQLAFPWFRAE